MVVVEEEDPCGAAASRAVGGDSPGGGASVRTVPVVRFRGSCSSGTSGQSDDAPLPSKIALGRLMGATYDDITPSCDGATRASELPIHLLSLRRLFKLGLEPAKLTG